MGAFDRQTILMSDHSPSIGIPAIRLEQAQAALRKKTVAPPEAVSVEVADLTALRQAVTDIHMQVAWIRHRLEYPPPGFWRRTWQALVRWVQT